MMNGMSKSHMDVYSDGFIMKLYNFTIGMEDYDIIDRFLITLDICFMLFIICLQI